MSGRFLILLLLYRLLYYTIDRKKRRCLLDLNEFRKYAHVISDWMADYFKTVEEYPVRSQVKAGDIAAKISPSCPEHGESMETIFSSFKDVIIPGITHWQHPRFFAFFNANTSPPSVLAEMLTATLAAQCMLWETSPAATELEARMTEWMRDLTGLPEEFTGSIQESGSVSNLCGIIAACEKITSGRFSTEGLAGGPPLTVYASSEAHSSVEKGARIAGIGVKNVRKIPVCENYDMDTQALMSQITQDRAEGCIPACIVASFGATGLGSIDPVDRIGRIAQTEGIHLHVDAAWAGNAMILPEVRSMLNGLEFVDSYVFNPHKWLFTNFDCSLFYMRDPSRLVNALSITPAYLESKSSDEMPEYRDWSISLARRFRALKLWFVMRSYGVEGLRKKIRSNLDWAQRLAEHIRSSEDFELVTGPILSLLSFRYVPEWAKTDETLDRVNTELHKRLNDSGELYLTKTRAKGRIVIRFVIGQTSTTWQHIEEAWATIQKTAAEIETGS